MSGIREEGSLDYGVGFNDEVHCSFTLRPATLADTYAAAAAVSIPDNIGEDKPASVAYQMAVDDALILCQIEQLGTLNPVPSVQALVVAVDPDDMAIFRQAAANLKKKLRLSRPGFPPIVEPNTSSFAPALP